MRGPGAGNSAQSLQCPIESDSAISHKDANLTVTATGYSNGPGGFRAAACYTFVAGGGTGGACDSGVVAPGTGVRHIQLPLAIWNGAGASDYVFITVTLGPAISGSFNTFWGYSISKP